MITRSSIAFEDFLGSSIAPQVMPPWRQVEEETAKAVKEGEERLEALYKEQEEEVARLVINWQSRSESNVEQFRQGGGDDGQDDRSQERQNVDQERSEGDEMRRVAPHLFELSTEEREDAAREHGEGFSGDNGRQLAAYHGHDGNDGHGGCGGYDGHGGQGGHGDQAAGGQGWFDFSLAPLVIVALLLRIILI